jgi:hypothetical protein
VAVDLVSVVWDSTVIIGMMRSCLLFGQTAADEVQWRLVRVSLRFGHRENPNVDYVQKSVAPHARG